MIKTKLNILNINEQSGYESSILSLYTQVQDSQNNVSFTREFNEITGLNYSFDLISSLNIAKEDITFIYISCESIMNSLLEDTPTPLKFKITLDSTVFGKQSQLLISNLEDLEIAEINISEIEVPLDKTGKLTIVIGHKE